MARGGFAGAVPCLALVLAACAFSPRPVGEAHQPRVAVAPLNLAIALPSELKYAVEPVQDEILGHLLSTGARVALVRPADARVVWQHAVVSARAGKRGSASLTETAAVFVRSLAEDAEADFDLLVLPSLAYREAHIHGRYVSWDGVEREMVVLGEEEPPSHRDPDVQHGWLGELPGVSLHVLVFRRDGRLVGEGWGGLELAYRAVEPFPTSSGAAYLYPKEAPFDDLEHVREGVAIALDPFVP